MIMVLMALIRSAIGEKYLTEHERVWYDMHVKPCAASGKADDTEVFSKLCDIAKHNDIAHLLALGLRKNGLLDDSNRSLERELFKAMYRHENQMFEYRELCNELESAKICFLPLKGRVLCSYYPEPWQRTCCDTDILVKDEEFESAADILENKLGYTRLEKLSHDISFVSRTGAHVELHFKLGDDDMDDKLVSILDEVWSRAHATDECPYRYEMDDDMFRFYHIAHMAKHFMTGGCGIRPFVDLWLYEQKKGSEDKESDELLRRGGLLKFASTVRELCGVWFDGRESSKTLLAMERFVVWGGIFGTDEGRVVIKNAKAGGRLKFILSRAILSTDELKAEYSSLEGREWASPIYQLRRWCKLLNKKSRSHALRELRSNSGITADTSKKAKAFFDSIGL